MKYKNVKKKNVKRCKKKHPIAYILHLEAETPFGLVFFGFKYSSPGNCGYVPLSVKGMHVGL